MIYIEIANLFTNMLVCHAIALAHLHLSACSNIWRR